MVCQCMKKILKHTEILIECICCVSQLKSLVFHIFSGKFVTLLVEGVKTLYIVNKEQQNVKVVWSVSSMSIIY